MTSLLQELNAELAALVEGVWRSLVQIRSGGRGAGAGTVWHPDGLILTNAHVVEHQPLRVALPDGRDLPARLLARDSERDVAALAVPATGLPAIALGDSRVLRPGQLVLALGHPWGVHGAVTVGTVVAAPSGALGHALSRDDLIAVSLPLRPGNSGGPLVDEWGRLIGINTMMAGPEVGMAVPVHAVKEFLREALASRSAAA